jgi:hypothetical protein
MKFLLAVGILVLCGALVVLVRNMFMQVSDEALTRKLEGAKWRRTEYVDDDGNTHVVLRRAIRRGRELIFADPDREIAVIAADDPDFRRHLADARVEGDVQVRQVDYRRQ